MGRAELGSLKHHWGLIAGEGVDVFTPTLSVLLSYTQDVSVTQKTNIQPRVVVEDSCNASI